jgi:hypothetical protein
MANWSKKDLTGLFMTTLASIRKECEFIDNNFIVDILAGTLRERGFEVKTVRPFGCSFDPIVHQQGTVLFFEKQFIVNCENSIVLHGSHQKRGKHRSRLLKPVLQSVWHQIVFNDLCLNISRRILHDKKGSAGMH